MRLIESWFHRGYIKQVQASPEAQKDKGDCCFLVDSSISVLDISNPEERWSSAALQTIPSTWKTAVFQQAPFGEQGQDFKIAEVAS